MDDRDHGQLNSRGEECDGGPFHTLLPGPDRFCPGRRPGPKDTRLIAAERWWAEERRTPMPSRGSKEWGDALEEWAATQSD